MADLRVTVAGVDFSNPLIAASGTFGFGREYNEFYPLSTLGGISSKGITLKERLGNPPPRITEAPGCMLNAIGLQNPGVDYFIEHDLPWLKEQGTVVIANIAGNTPEEYCAMAEKLSDTNVDMLEMNISCPNVKEGGMAFGTSCASAAEVVKAVRRVYKKHLMVKLSPNVTNIQEIALAVESEGADSVSLINTLLGMAIDAKKRKPVLSTITGGLSGACVKPIALRMVWQVAKAVKIPVVGLGGIMCATDAIEFLLAGASAVQIGTANFIDPAITVKIIEGINDYLDENGCKSVKEIIGLI